MLFLIPETEVGIIAPSSPSNVVLLEHGQHILGPLVGQFTVNRLIDTPLTAEQLQVILLSSFDSVFEISTNLVDIPYLSGVMVLVNQCLDRVRGSLIVFLRHQHARIVYLASILADRCPPSTIVGQNHRIIVVEREDDIFVTFRYLQILHGLVALPQIRTDNEGALWLTLAQCLMNLDNQLIPLLVVVGNRLVHELISHRVVAIALQYVRQLVPHVDELLLRLIRSEQRIGIGLSLIHGIEIV